MNNTISKTPKWITDDQLHVWHPYTQMFTAPAPIPIKKAEGIYFHTVDNRKILDGISSWWVNIHGHSHPRLNEALRIQADKLSQIIFAGFTHEPAARLATQLVERTPENLNRVFFSDDGSTAVEVALKMSCQYWHNQGQSQRNLFVSLKRAYHGDTFGAMSVGNVSEFHSRFSNLLFEVQRVSQSLSSIEKLLERERERVAALIIEPMVQAAGGMIIWPSEFLRHLREITHRYNIPLIADEVFTGFGRTGKMFACSHGPIEPDLMCLSKGLTAGYLPLAVTLASEEIFEGFLSKDRSETFFHGHSFTGNALSCAVALESLALFDENNCLNRISQLEMLFKTRLDSIANLSQVKETRGIGALAVIELQPREKGGYFDTSGAQLTEAFLQRDILLRPLGNVLYFLPPYVITDQEVNRVFDTIEEVLDSEI